MRTEANMSGRVKLIINRCRKGERLCKSQGPKTVSGYFFEPSGHAAGEKSAKQAIASGQLVGLNDGMFGESQTWVAKEALL
jgi:hypothetical protein